MQTVRSIISFDLMYTTSMNWVERGCATHKYQTIISIMLGESVELIQIEALCCHWGLCPHRCYDNHLFIMWFGAVLFAHATNHYLSFLRIIFCWFLAIDAVHLISHCHAPAFFLFVTEAATYMYTLPSFNFLLGACMDTCTNKIYISQY